MLRKFAVSVYVACLVVIGIAIGESLAYKKAHAAANNICWPSQATMYLVTAPGGFTVDTNVDCRSGVGTTCEWWAYYDLFQWNANMHRYVWIDSQKLPFSGTCGQLDGGDSVEPLHPGTFFIQAYLYQGTPDSSGNKLAFATKNIVVP